MNTKTRHSSVLVLLVLFCCLQPVFLTEGSRTGKKCCMMYDTKRIPLAMVVSFYQTSSSCSKKAIVFVTKRDRHICVNPADAWVMSQTAVVERRSASAPTPKNSTDTPAAIAAMTTKA
ncbi:hypothetical protein GJAV_G00066880 [Gymnothorax javanicus]|nr:hypothetical protein GJAV_G00066880 [Gymnothorax javanicus]